MSLKQRATCWVVHFHLISWLFHPQAAGNGVRECHHRAVATALGLKSLTKAVPPFALYLPPSSFPPPNPQAPGDFRSSSHPMALRATRDTFLPASSRWLADLCPCSCCSCQLHQHPGHSSRVAPASGAACRVLRHTSWPCKLPGPSLHLVLGGCWGGRTSLESRLSGGDPQGPAAQI